MTQIKWNREKLISTLEIAQRYVNNITVTPCLCNHEKPKNPMRVRHCLLQIKNAWCTHVFDFSDWPSGWDTLEQWYRFIGLQLFVIAYFLNQNWYEYLDWYIPENKFRNDVSWNKFFDDNIRDYYRNPVLCNKVTPEMLKDKQLIDWNDLLKNYVVPIKNTLREYAKRTWCLVEDKGTHVIKF